MIIARDARAPAYEFWGFCAPAKIILSIQATPHMCHVAFRDCPGGHLVRCVPSIEAWAGRLHGFEGARPVIVYPLAALGRLCRRFSSVQTPGNIDYRKTDSVMTTARLRNPPAVSYPSRTLCY